ncbi:MAG TPA: DUF4129 domain-containing protein [Mesotoga infera]|uniref:DUF4129 domain-containing protein n=1 Tax=Mesotoga infera TaxID=1236046 RepID=A0A7C1GTM8_9BACT|nr:DUF4129 domain-containing protein [Mesotoga infera]
MVGFLFYLGRTKAGCSIYLLLPILFFTIMILLLGVLRTGVALSLSALGAIVGIVLTMDRKEYLSVFGLFIVGISLSASPVLQNTGAYITLMVILIRVLLIPNVPKIFVALGVIIPLVAILSLGNYRGGLLSVRMKSSVVDINESQSEMSIKDVGSAATEVPFPSGIRNTEDPNEFSMIEEVSEIGLLDSLFPFGFYTIALVLVVSIARKAVKEFRGWWRLVLPLMVLISVVLVLVGGFMYLRSLPLSEEFVFGAGGISGEPSASLSPPQETGLQEDEEAHSEVAPRMGLSAYDILRWTTLVGIAILTSLLAYIVFVITGKRQTVSSTPLVEESRRTEGIQKSMIIPDDCEGRAFIISSYQLLRNIYFDDLRHLTPFELIRQTRNETNLFLKELTEIYLPVKYGNCEPDEAQCREFRSLLLELKEYLDTLIKTICRT